MESMYKLRDMLCKELDEVAQKGELGAGDLEIAHKLTDTIKNIDKIEMYEEQCAYSQGGYSQGGYSRNGYSRGGDWDASIRGSYGRGNSYANRGMHYVHGHYSRAGANETLREQVNEMMHQTDDDRVKEALRRIMSMVDG